MHSHGRNYSLFAQLQRKARAPTFFSEELSRPGPLGTLPLFFPLLQLYALYAPFLISLRAGLIPPPLCFACQVFYFPNLSHQLFPVASLCPSRSHVQGSPTGSPGPVTSRLISLIVHSLHPRHKTHQAD